MQAPEKVSVQFLLKLGLLFVLLLFGFLLKAQKAPAKAEEHYLINTYPPSPTMQAPEPLQQLYYRLVNHQQPSAASF